ncbi:chromate transporter [Paenibacillus rhizoplanae]
MTFALVAVSLALLLFTQIHPFYLIVGGLTAGVLVVQYNQKRGKEHSYGAGENRGEPGSAVSGILHLKGFMGCCGSCCTFFKVGLVSFGGGYAVITLIQREVAEQGWLDSGAFSGNRLFGRNGPGFHRDQYRHPDRLLPGGGVGELSRQRLALFCRRLSSSLVSLHSS